MGGGKKTKTKNSFVKDFMKKAQGALKLVIGNSEVYEQEDSGGQLKFDPSIMLKLNVTFDKQFLPKEKVVKLNVRGNTFFHDLKRTIREVTCLFLVYPHYYETQFDVYRKEAEQRLMDELNNDYQLNLKKIIFISEDEVARTYQRRGITNIKKPYNLKKGELLIIAGGFVNFDNRGVSLATVKTNIMVKPVRKSIEKKTTVIECKVHKTPKVSNRDIKKSYDADYYDKFSPKAGAYFYIGGQWYHNLFIPELYSEEAARYFYFRTADDGKHLKLFSDPQGRGVDIRAGFKSVPGKEYEELQYTINPEYFAGTGISQFKLSVKYDFKEPFVLESQHMAKQESVETIEMKPRKKPAPPAVEDLPVSHRQEFTPVPAATQPPLEKTEDINTEVLNQAEPLEKVREPKAEPITKAEPEPYLLDEPEKEENLPYLENQVLLLPMPYDNPNNPDDSAQYRTIIGSEENGISFYASYPNREIAIQVPGDDRVDKWNMDHEVHYSVKLGHTTYTISNEFLSRIRDADLKNYFAWTVESSENEKLELEEAFYIFGREPLDNLRPAAEGQQYDTLVRLNPGNESFWSIGASRDHGIIVKSGEGYKIYNLSTSYPIYIMKASHQVKPVIHPIRLEPVPHNDNEKQRKLTQLLAELKETVLGLQLVPNLEEALNQFADCKKMESHDLVFIGNRVYKYVIPVVMESPLSDMIKKSILRKIELNKSIIRG